MEIDALVFYEMRLWHYLFLWDVTVESRVLGSASLFCSLF